MRVVEIGKAVFEKRWTMLMGLFLQFLLMTLAVYNKTDLQERTIRVIAESGVDLVKIIFWFYSM